MTEPANILFAQIKEKGLETLESLINSRSAENCFFDFKRKANQKSTKLDDPDQKNLAKALSGFANSGGGILIWGVDAKSNNGPLEKMPISDLASFASEYEAFMSRLVVPVVEGVVSHPVFEKDSGSGYLVTLIPKSISSPHRSIKSGNYYVRSGDSFVAADHYYLEYMFGRRKVPALCLNLGIEELYSGNGNDNKNFLILLNIKNNGTAVAKYAMLRVEDMDIVPPYTLDPTDNPFIKVNHLDSFDDRRYFSKLEIRLPPEMVIYPGDEVTLMKMGLVLTKMQVRAPEFYSFRPLNFTYSLFAEDFPGQINRTITKNLQEIVALIYP